MLCASAALGYRVIKSGDFSALNQTKVIGQRYTWRSVEKRHWQALIENQAEALLVSEPPVGRCGEGMVDIEGMLLLDLQGTDSTGYVEELQNRACTNWISKEFPARCQSFDREQWLELSSDLPRKPLTYCMDRYEYPNVRGENPVIVVDYFEARGLCKARGKRLCTESEWTLACEGNEGQPYPYGYERNAEACVVDRTWRQFKEGALFPRDSDGAREEVDRLWQGQPSGSRPGCRSSYGVYDLTGNVDEWTQSVRTSGFASVLKGGYWGPVRARCRPSTRAHNETFVAYQQGFRCCSDIPAVPAAGEVVALARPRKGEPGGAVATREARGRTIEDVPKAIEDQSELLTLRDLDTVRPQVGVGQACNTVSNTESFGTGLALASALAWITRRRARR